MTHVASYSREGLIEVARRDKLAIRSNSLAGEFWWSADELQRENDDPELGIVMHVRDVQTKSRAPA